MPLAWINRSVDQCKNNILSYFFGSSCWFHKRGHSSAAPKSFDDWSKHQAWSNVCVCVCVWCSCTGRMRTETESQSHIEAGCSLTHGKETVPNLVWPPTSSIISWSHSFRPITFQQATQKMMCSFNHQLLQLPLEWVRYFLSFRRWATIANGWQRSVLVDKTGHQTKNQWMDNKNEVFAHSVTST